MFTWRDRQPLLDRLVTDRDGGSSVAPFDGLNLGGHVGDDPGAVAANRALLAEQVGLPVDRVLFLNQVHGTNVVVVDGPWSQTTPVPPADAVVTTAPDLALAVLVADCVPVLLSDTESGVIGAIHAGRPGMTGRIVDHAVAAMRDLGAHALEAVVGPSVCGRCYEVPEPMRAAAAATSPVSATVSWHGSAAIDVAAGVVDQLSGHGIPVTWLPGCTREREDLYSYRRSARTGRFAALVRRYAVAAPSGGRP
jgi:YfiH family protein